MKNTTYKTRLPLAITSTFVGWAITLLIFFLWLTNFLNAGASQRITELLPIVFTTGITAFIFSFILARFPLNTSQDNDKRGLYKRLLKATVYGIIISIIVSGVTAFFLLNGLSQILGAFIGGISYLIYWHLSKIIFPRTFTAMIAMTLFTPVTILVFLFVAWPLAEKYLPLLAYQFGAWDSRQRIEQNLARSIKVGDQFIQHESLTREITGYLPENLEGGFILGRMPTYSFCIKNGVVKRIWVFKEGQDITLHNNCSDD